MSRSRHVLIAVCTGLTAWMAEPAGVGPRFFRDDPIAVDPERQDATGVKPHYPSQASDALQMLGGREGRHPQRAVNVNTVDEVPDSSWYTNRHDAAADASVEQIVQGPFLHPGPVDGIWTIASGAGDGVRPRLTARDASGTLYFLRFDSRSNPELATGAEAISTRLFHALGYHTPENHLIGLHREDFVIGDGAPLNDGDGRRRLMTPTDLDILLASAARGNDGRYRAIASRMLDGVDLGPFRFAGVRPDDPNDVFPHEHRRELRGLRVVCAWLNHDDTRTIDTQDVLVENGGRRLVRHYLTDFGSTLGSGSVHTNRVRARNEYTWATRPKLLTALTLGFYVRPWIDMPDPGLPSIGRYEAVFFAPEQWTPPYRNAAFDRARPDDEFWAARRVMAISDRAIRAVVSTGQYADPRAETYLTDTLIARRDAIGRVWLNTVLPLVDCQLAPAGSLTCTNIAVEMNVAEPAIDYQVQWYSFDNDTDTRETVGEASVSRAPEFAAPRALIDTSEFVMAEIRGRHRQHVGWATPMHVYFRRTADGWRTVGLTRLEPDTD
jgi:hypothetical protein